MSAVIDQLNDHAERWEHGHAELTDGCALCRQEFAEVMQIVHGPKESN
ncbi:hypothetical protein ACFQ6Q_00075 [Streptomyces sp. NPDC056437]